MSAVPFTSSGFEATSARSALRIDPVRLVTLLTLIALCILNLVARGFAVVWFASLLV